MEGPFGGEGDENLLALSPSGRRPRRGSVSFERGCDGVDIVLGLLGHEGGGVVGGGGASWALGSAFLRLTCPFERSNITQKADLISFRRGRRNEI